MPARYLIILSKKIFLRMLLICVACATPFWGQDADPKFWSRGGKWGPWVSIPQYPGLAVRSACGDDTTLNNFLASSEDWQLRSRYTEPIVVVWRVEFFDRTTGRNRMGAWMLEHLRAGEVSDGWTVMGGHCQQRNAITIQVKCMASEGEEDECFKDPQGSPYPARPAQAYRGDHLKPEDTRASTAGHSTSSRSSSASRAHALEGTVWRCTVDGRPENGIFDAFQDYEITFLKGFNAIHGYVSPIDWGRWYLVHSTWRSDDTMIVEQMDGSYEVNGKEYVEFESENGDGSRKHFIDVDTGLGPSTPPETPFEKWEKEVSWAAYYTSVTTDTMNGYLAVANDEKNGYAEKYGTEDVDKRFPITCKRFE
jgi:hypothetical protein